MAINPFPRIQPLDIPTALPSGARAPEGTFANLASIGDAIGAYRERNAMGELLKGAVDPTTGVLDTHKAATLIALSGRDPTKYLTLAEAAQRAKEAQSYREQSLEELRRHRGVEEGRLKLEEGRAARPIITIKGSGTPLDPYIQFSTDPVTGKTTSSPLEGGMPAVPPPPPRAPVPGSSALPGGGPDVAEASPAGFPGGPGGSPFDPEQAPPYRVAGPMMRVPMPESDVIQAQATQPAAQPAARPAGSIQRPDAVRPPPSEGITPEQDQWVEQHIHPQYRAALRSITNYARDPYKLEKREQEYLFPIASQLIPGWSPDEFARREKAKVGTIGEGEKKTIGEQAGKFSQVLGFNQNWDDNYTVPGIAGYLGAGAASVGVGYSSPKTAAKMLSFFQNRPGVTEEDALKAVEFWQGYRRYVNVVRNEQFGASLTPSEQKAFAEADISPGMDPRVIRQNLDVQQRVLRGAMARTANGLLAEGVPPDRIEARMGVPLSVLQEEPPTAKPGQPNPDVDKYRNPPGMSAAVSRVQDMLKRFGDTPENRKAARGALDQIDPSGSLSKQMGL